MERALGAAQVPAGEVGVVRRPRKLVIGSPKPVIFQRGLGGGGRRVGPGAPGRTCPAAPRPESSAAGTSGTARWPGKQAFGAGRGGGVKVLWSALSTHTTPRRPWPPAQMQRTARVTLPPAQSARRPPPGREVAGPRRDTGPCVPSPTLRAGGRARWAPGEGRGGMRAAGGSFGTRGERDSRPASRAAPRSQAILL